MGYITIYESLVVSYRYLLDLGSVRLLRVGDNGVARAFSYRIPKERDR
jgi:hypothetical protein